MKNKHILVIAPASIPITGAEAICNVKLLRVLSENGYKIDLISKRMKYTHYPETNLAELGLNLNSVNTIEVDNKISLKVIWQHLCCLFIFGTVFKGAHWAYCVLKVAKELCKKNQYDAIITKNSPSELLGYYFKKKNGIKWIATWNDPYPTKKYPKPYGNGVNAKLFILERPLLKKMEEADYHIFPNQRIRDYMSNYINIPAEKTRIIPHVVIPREHIDTPHENLKIVHLGNVLPPRDATPFLRALSEFIKNKQDAKIEIAFIGQTPQSIKDYIKTTHLEKYVKVFPPVKYEESQEILETYDIQLIVEAPCEEGIFLPTKVSDSMQLGKPIFTISPSVGVLNDLYKKGHISYFSSVKDEKDILATLEQVYNDFTNGKLKTFSLEKSYSPQTIFQQYDEII
ncbi:predicted protein [Prevotella sp. CAG:1092]|nr:predicted protein [Prevotella sp. CAG:1092]